MFAIQQVQSARETLTTTPACPNCGRPMHLARITRGAGGAQDVRTFGCGECGVWTTEAAGDDRIG
jgi:hypothetical protein